jgi:hypothetical protein
MAKNTEGPLLFIFTTLIPTLKGANTFRKFLKFPKCGTH